MYKAIGYAYEQAIKTINWAKDGKSFLDNGTEVRISPAKKIILYVSLQKTLELFHLKLINMLP